MQELGIGAGLGALGLWLFIAAVVVAGIWDSIRKREAQHETLRRVIESGQPVDQELIDRLLGGEKRIDRDLKVSGLIMLGVAPGLVALGAFIGLLDGAAFFPILEPIRLRFPLYNLCMGRRDDHGPGGTPPDVSPPPSTRFCHQEPLPCM